MDSCWRCGLWLAHSGLAHDGATLHGDELWHGMGGARPMSSGLCAVGSDGLHAGPSGCWGGLRRAVRAALSCSTLLQGWQQASSADHAPDAACVLYVLWHSLGKLYGSVTITLEYRGRRALVAQAESSSIGCLPSWLVSVTYRLWCCVARNYHH